MSSDALSARNLEVVSAHDALVGSLRDRILAGEFEPGSSLSDVALATEYRVARPTVRAAVQALVHEGLLRREPRRRAFVPRLGPDDIRDLYYVRIPLELAAVDALVRGSADLGRAGRAVERFEALGEEASWREAVDADIGFHAALVAAAGSPRLERAYEALQSEIRLALIQLKPAYSAVAPLAAEHRLLLEAVRSGPARKAVGLMRDHLEQAVEDLTTSS
jgi:DNA-binding GntR family transcriptional regulator